MANRKLITVIALMLVSLTNLFARIETQQLDHSRASNQNQAVTEDDGERVDKLASAAGDLYFRPQQQQPIQLIDQDSLAELVGYQLDQNQLPNYVALRSSSAPLIGIEGPSMSRNYHTLMNDFKQSYMMSNPLRESRAFKPKLMSTARGFGKRSLRIKGIHHPSPFVSEGRLLNGFASSIGVSNGDNGPSTTSRGFEWPFVNPTRLHSLEKHINNKFIDYNGNVDLKQ